MRHRVSVVSLPDNMCLSATGAASIHVGHSISILRNECANIESVKYLDHNQPGLFALSRMLRAFDKRIRAEKTQFFFTEEILDLLLRSIMENLYEVTDGIEHLLVERLGVSVHEIAVLTSATRLAFREQINDIQNSGSDVAILYASHSAIFPIIVSKFIRDAMPFIKIVLMDKFTYEPMTPYVSAIFTGKDVKGNDVGLVQKFDKLIEPLKKQLPSIIDIVVVGEGYDFLKNYFNKDLSIDEHGCTCVYSDRIELDALPLPDYTDMSGLYEFAEIEFERGCKYNCVFCERTRMMGNCISRHSPSYIIRMIDTIRNMGFEKFTLIDCAVNNNTEFTVRVLQEMIDSNITINYQANIRTVETPEKLMSLLSKTGCKEVAIGLESGSSEVLESMNKNQDLGLSKALLSSISRHGMRAMIFLIVGFPVESVATDEQTIELLKSVKADCDIDIVEVEFYHAGHIQALQPKLFEQYGILWEDPYDIEVIMNSAFCNLKPGVFGAVRYERGLTRAEFKHVITLYNDVFKSHSISLAMWKT